MKKRHQPAKFWDKANFPVAAAHRGGDAAGFEKENSLKAFKAAYDMGYRWFETDVVSTSDGVLLAIHGRGFQKRPNKDLPSRLKVQRMKYAEAKKNLIVGGEKVLTLREILDTFPDIKLFVDPKTYRAAPVLADFLISRPQDLNRVCIGSFHARNTGLVRKRLKKTANGDIACAAIGSFRGLWLTLSAKATFLRPLLRFYVRWTRISAFYLPYKKLEGARGRKLVKFAHKNGLKVAAYTPNDQKSIEVSLSAGADVIMSDNVKLLKHFIKP